MIVIDDLSALLRIQAVRSCKDYETHCTNLTGCDESEKGNKNETEKELTTLKWSGNNTETSPPRSDRRLTT